MPVSRNPFVRARDALRHGRLLKRALPNLLHDIRYGGYLGGSIPSPFRDAGIHGTESTDWVDLEILFGQPDSRPRADDVIVDVGCGKGRTLAYFSQATRGRNRVVGIEINPAIGEETRRRFRGVPGVEVVVGDAIELLPAESTLIYLSNPFFEPIMRRFVDRLHDGTIRLEKLRVVYYNCHFTAPFVERGWTIEPIAGPLAMMSALLRPPAS